MNCAYNVRCGGMFEPMLPMVLPNLVEGKGLLLNIKRIEPFKTNFKVKSEFTFTWHTHSICLGYVNLNEKLGTG